ncbi:MAG: hypothetical protein IT430_12435 [Phycisphaerales bacterium]|nr:hypothetical protein [Phycisphaerales bacterium]
MKLRMGLASACLGLAAGIAQAGTLYTIRTGDDMLRALDTQSLTFTDIGPLGVAFDFGDLGYDPNSGKMYMVQGFAGTGLYTVDLNNGSAAFVGTHGSPDMFSLVYDPNGGKMYCGESTRNFRFCEINLSTAQLSVIGPTSIGMDAMTYDPNQQLIVAAFAGPGDLYSVNPSNASTTLLHDGAFFNNCGMAYDDDTGLYWLIDWSGNLYSIDPNNGYARTLRLSGLGAHDGLAAVTGGAGRYTLRISGACPGTLTLSWNNATPSVQQGIVFGQNQGSTIIPGGPCAGTMLGVQGSVQLVNTVGTGSGSGSVNGRAGTAACGHYLQLVEAGSCNTSNVAQIP